MISLSHMCCFLFGETPAAAGITSQSAAYGGCQLPCRGAFSGVGAAQRWRGPCCGGTGVTDCHSRCAHRLRKDGGRDRTQAPPPLWRRRMAIRHPAGTPRPKRLLPAHPQELLSVRVIRSPDLASSYSSAFPFPTGNSGSALSSASRLLG